MKKLAIGLMCISLLLTFVAPAQATDWRNLEEKLNPERKKLWVLIGDKEACGFVDQPMKRYGISKRGYGHGLIASAEGFIQSNHPIITTFSPDQITGRRLVSLGEIPSEYHYLFVIPISEMNKILAEGKCVIVSGKVKINVARQTLNDRGEWTVVSETERESYVTLIAAPNKRSLKKAVARFFTLTEIPLKPLIWQPK